MLPAVDLQDDGADVREIGRAAESGAGETVVGVLTMPLVPAGKTEVHFDAWLASL